MANEKRLIDANALIDWLNKHTGFRGNCEDCTDIDCLDCVIENAIKNAPTVDAVEVVHGRWLKTENGIRKNINTGEMVMAYMHDCSVCGWHTGNQGRNFNYCPNCGAKMDGGNEDG